MTSTSTDTPQAPAPAGKRIAQLYDSLTVRAVAGLLAMIALIIALLFLGIDSFVSAQFRALHKQRIVYLAHELNEIIRADLSAMEALARLVVNDSDLRQSAQYHLLLEGERRPLEEDARRIAGAFRFDLMEVFDGRGTTIVGNDDDLVSLAIWGRERVPTGDAGTWSAPVWRDDELWIAATSSLMVNERVIAWIGIGKRSNFLRRAAGMFGEGVNIELVPEGSAEVVDAIRIPVLTSQGLAAAIQISVGDTVREALDRTKTVIALTLLGSAVMLAIAAVFYLRSLLRPVHELTRAAASLPTRLESAQAEPVSVSGQGEVARLVKTFNRMVEDLQRLRGLEAEVREKEKLSAIGRVALRVAHDINNPLTVIKNSAHLLKQDLVGHESARVDLDRILHHCQRCTSTVDNLLRFGRPLRLKLESIDVNACMRAFLDDLAQRRAGVPVRFSTQVPDGLRIVGDRHQLEQMMDNLMDNALEANGGREVDVETGRDGDRTYIRLTDHGAGFDPAHLDEVFDLFYTSKTHGTGLGLPNALAIAHAHQGEIRITDPAAGQVTVWLREAGPART